MKKLVVTVISIMILAANVKALPVQLVLNDNQGFENPAGTGMTYPANYTMGWNGTAGGYASYGASALFRPGTPLSGQVGDQVGAVWTNVNWYAPNFTHGWTAGDTLIYQAGMTYTLTALVGKRAGVLSLQNPTLQLLARKAGVGDTLLAADYEIKPALIDNSFVLYSTTITIPDESIYEGLGIVVRLTGGVGVSGQYREMLFDDVKLTMVPEPATLLLLGIGGLVAIKKRK